MNQDKLTKKQIALMQYLYNHDRTLGEISEKFHASVDDSRLMVLDLGSYAFFIHWDETTMSKTVARLTDVGEAFVEHAVEHQKEKREACFRFWISIIFVPLLTWLLSSLGSPKEFMKSVTALFSP